MTNKQASADHLLTTEIIAWRLGHADTNCLIDHAFWAGQAFEARLGAHHWRALIGGRQVGLLRDGTLDLIRWPFVDSECTDAEYYAWLHDRADRCGSVAKCYFIGGDEGPVKIGYSTSVDDRLKTIQAHSPLRVRVLATRDGGEDRETAYHAQFAEHRLHGEWFERSPSIESEIERLGGGVL